MILYFYSHRVIFRYQADRSDWCDPQPSSSFLVALALISFECPEQNHRFQSTLPPTEQKSKIETEGYPMPTITRPRIWNKTANLEFFAKFIQNNCHGMDNTYDLGWQRAQRLENLFQAYLIAQYHCQRVRNQRHLRLLQVVISLQILE